MKKKEEKPKKVVKDLDFLYDADPKCKHVIITLWSGVKCSKCNGWFCY